MKLTDLYICVRIKNGEHTFFDYTTIANTMAESIKLLTRAVADYPTFQKIGWTCIKVDLAIKPSSDVDRKVMDSIKPKRRVRDGSKQQS